MGRDERVIPGALRGVSVRTGETPPPRIAATIGLALLLSACASRPDYRPVSDTPVRIGKAYTIRGATYVPRAEPGYDVLGYASWYGNESGNQTANGERFRPGWVTAAHKTLPLPTYVEVTALDTGRRIVVRINDRGPFAGGGSRIIDLSRGADGAVKIVTTNFDLLFERADRALRHRLLLEPACGRGGLRAAVRRGPGRHALPRGACSR